MFWENKISKTCKWIVIKKTSSKNWGGQNGYFWKVGACPPSPRFRRHCLDHCLKWDKFVLRTHLYPLQQWSNSNLYIEGCVYAVFSHRDPVLTKCRTGGYTSVDLPSTASLGKTTHPTAWRRFQDLALMKMRRYRYITHRARPYT